MWYFRGRVADVPELARFFEVGIRGHGRRSAAEVNRDFAPIRHHGHHVAFTTKPGGVGLHHAQRQADGDCRIDRVAAFLQDFGAGLRGQRVGGRDHAGFRLKHGRNRDRRSRCRQQQPACRSQ